MQYGDGGVSSSPPESAYFRPCRATASHKAMSSSASHGPFLRLPHTWLTHLLRQSLFVRKGSFAATRLQSVERPSSAINSQHELGIQGLWYFPSPISWSWSSVKQEQLTIFLNTSPQNLIFFSSPPHRHAAAVARCIHFRISPWRHLALEGLQLG